MNVLVRIKKPLVAFPGVQSAAVNVICELARKNPRNYLSLAPIFFKLMTSSTNNWMLIKIIKLVSSLQLCHAYPLRRGLNVTGSNSYCMSQMSAMCQCDKRLSKLISHPIITIIKRYLLFWWQWIRGFTCVVVLDANFIYVGLFDLLFETTLWSFFLFGFLISSLAPSHL